MDSELMNVRQVFHVLLQHDWILAACLALGGASVLLYTILYPPQFKSSASLQVTFDEPPILRMDNYVGESLKGIEELKTIEQNIDSRVVLGRVVDRLKLEDNSTFFDGKKPAHPTRDMAVDRLLGLCSASLRKGTHLIDLTVKHPNREMALLLNSTWVNEFISYNTEKKTMSARLTREFLSSEAERLRKKMLESDQTLQTFKENSGAVSLDSDQNIVVEKLKELNADLTVAKVHHLQTSAESQLVASMGDDTDKLLTVPDIASNPSVIDLEHQVSAQQTLLDDLSKRYKSKHPFLIQAKTQLAGLEQGLKKNILASRDSIVAADRSASESVKGLQNALDEQEKKALNLNRLSIEYNALARVAKSNKELYDYIMLRLNEAQVTSGIVPNEVTVAEPAYVPNIPESSHRMIITIFCLSSGLMFGMGLAFALNTLDTSFKSSEEAEQVLQLYELATIPAFSSKNKQTRLPTLQDGLDQAIFEAFRNLTASLTMLGRQEKHKSFIFASATEGDGRTFCCVNTAIMFAQRGYRTLLMDGDLLNPSLHHLFDIGIPSDDNLPAPPIRGMNDFLAGRCEFQQAVYSTGTKDLDFMPVGTRTSNPSELLTDEPLKDLFDQVFATYDRVFIDTSSLHTVSDSIIKLQYAQSICFVIRWGKTPRENILRALEIIRRLGREPSGFILNQAPPTNSWIYNQYYDQFEKVQAGSLTLLQTLTQTFRKIFNKKKR